MVTDTKSPALQFSAAPDKSACLGPAKGCSLFAQVRQELDSLHCGRKTLTQIPGRSEKWGQQPPPPVGFQHWADWRCPPQSLHTSAGAHTEQLLTLRRTPRSVCSQPPRAQEGRVYEGVGETAQGYRGGLLENACLPWPSFLYIKAPAPLLRNRAHSLQGCYDLAGVLLCELGHFNWLQWTSTFHVWWWEDKCPLTGLLGGQEERWGTWSPPEPSTWWEYKHLLRWVSSLEASLGNDTGACAATDPQGEGRGLALRTSTGHPTSTFSVNRHGRLLLTPWA